MKKGKSCSFGRMLFLLSACVYTGVVVAGMMSCVWPQLFHHRLVGQRVLPEFNPEAVVAIEVDDSPFLTREHGLWQIAPFGGVPADEHSVSNLLSDIANLTVLSVVKDENRKSDDMKQMKTVVFRDIKGDVLGKLLLGKVHIKVISGLSDSSHVDLGRFLKLQGEVVLVREPLRALDSPRSFWYYFDEPMIPGDLYNANKFNLIAPVVSIDYEFDGNHFRMEKNSKGELDFVGMDDSDAVLQPLPVFLVRLPYMAQVSDDVWFSRLQKREKMSWGVLKVCSSDGTNEFTRSAFLYRDKQGTGYYRRGDWVFIQDQRHARFLLVSQDDLAARRKLRASGEPWQRCIRAQCDN